MGQVPSRDPSHALSPLASRPMWNRPWAGGSGSSPPLDPQRLCFPDAWSADGGQGGHWRRSRLPPPPLWVWWPLARAELRSQHSPVASRHSVARTARYLHSMTSVRVLRGACFPGWPRWLHRPPLPTAPPHPAIGFTRSALQGFFPSLGLGPRPVLRVWLFLGEHPGLGIPETPCTLGCLTSKNTEDVRKPQKVTLKLKAECVSFCVSSPPPRAIRCILWQVCDNSRGADEGHPKRKALSSFIIPFLYRREASCQRATESIRRSKCPQRLVTRGCPKSQVSPEGQKMLLPEGSGVGAGGSQGP